MWWNCSLSGERGPLRADLLARDPYHVGGARTPQNSPQGQGVARSRAPSEVGPSREARAWSRTMAGKRKKAKVGRPTSLESIQKLIEKKIEEAYERGRRDQREQSLDALEKCWEEVEK